jgi:hypothetical protein
MAPPVAIASVPGLDAGPAQFDAAFEAAGAGALSPLIKSVTALARVLSSMT